MIPRSLSYRASLRPLLIFVAHRAKKSKEESFNSKPSPQSEGCVASLQSSSMTGRGRGRGLQLLAKLKAAASEVQSEADTSFNTALGSEAFEDAEENQASAIEGLTKGTEAIQVGDADQGRGRGLARDEAPSLASQASKTSSTSRSAIAPEPCQQGERSYTSEGTKSIEPVIRRGHSGRSVDCSANFLKLRVEETKGIFYYEVRFEPTIDHRDERYRLMSQQVGVIGQTRTFDGAKLFLPIRLPDAVTELTSERSSDKEKIKLIITFQRQLTFDAPEAIQHYNILINRCMKQLKMCQIDRKFFYPDQGVPIPQHKIEIWPGFTTAVEYAEGGLMLQVDNSFRVLRQESCWDALRELARTHKANFKAEVQKQLLGVTVMTKHNYKTYRIDDIEFDKSPTEVFTTSKGETMTVIEYYQRQHGIKIKDDYQPLIVSSIKRKSAEARDVKQIVWLVPELCSLTGITDKMRSDFRVMLQIAKVSRPEPSKRQEALRKFIQEIRATPEAQGMLDGWGLQIVTPTVSLEARVLPGVSLEFGGGARERVNAEKADFTNLATSSPCLTSIDLSKWAILYVDRKDTVEITRKFVAKLTEVGQRMRMTIAQPKRCPLADDRSDTYQKLIRSVVDDTVQLVVLIVPQQRSDRYAAIKKLCNVEKPVASQVILEKTIQNERRLGSVSAKIALQINAKLGGELWGCRIPIPNLMVIGIDVYHDPTRLGNSIFGFVASMNDNMSRWLSVTFRQAPGQEMVDFLTLSFTKALAKYYNINATWPGTVLVFRDGVGDGQLNSTKIEIDQLLACFNKPELKPQFAFIVVQKRINTRIYSQCSGPAGRKIWDNPKPGTVVDYEITRRHWYDFFLVSQKASQGTVSPTHFVVVNDNTNFKPETMQQISYVLTHMYYNWTGTIRVPAPCQYAHKLAALEGEHVHHPASQLLEERLFYL